MLTVAASLYVMDQRDPPEPFTLDLDCSDAPTKSEFLKALRKAYENVYAEVKYRASIGENDPFKIKTRIPGMFGDVEITHENWFSWYIVGVPARLRNTLGLDKKYKEREDNMEKWRKRFGYEPLTS